MPKKEDIMSKLEIAAIEMVAIIKDCSLERAAELCLDDPLILDRIMSDLETEELDRLRENW